jgi:plasmid stabilization system protein ParE
MKLRWTDRSRRDLIDIAAYISEDNPAAARSWVARLRARARAATRAPRAGRRVPEIDRDDVREVLLGACRIVYRIAGSELHVLTVTEGHRSLRGVLPDDA